MKLSNKYFYSRHNFELKRYLNEGSSLHIINSNSKEKINENYSTKLFVDQTNQKGSINRLKSTNKLYNNIIITDLFETLEDNYQFLELIIQNLNSNGKLVLTSVNTKYKPIYLLLEKLGLKDKNLKHSYIHNLRIKNFITASGFEYINTYSKQILPFRLLGVGTLLNKIFEIILYKFNFGIRTYTIFRFKEEKIKKFSKSIIIPAKNEAGNLPSLVDRIPKFNNCQLIISCGQSEDNTLQVAKNISKNNNFFEINVIEQTGKGKANAVWESFEFVRGDIVAILDADISVDPETLTDFFKIIESNNADFVNGTRLIYEMEDGAMRFINKVGNRIFQFVISFILNIKLTDSLCGTKVFKKELIKIIYWWQDTFKLNDPFGDFDMLFSAAFSGQKIVDFPIRYKSRTYGTTQISRFKDGYKLIKYLCFSSLLFMTSSSNREKNF